MDVVSLEVFFDQILPEKHYNKRYCSGFQSCSSAGLHLLGGGWWGSVMPQKGIVMLLSFFTWFYGSTAYTTTLEQSCMKYSQNSRTKWNANR